MTDITGAQGSPSLRELQGEIGKWSMRCFGDNGSYFSLPALMGVVEEWGEFWEACAEGSLEEIKDALCDMGVYLFDYCFRESVDLEALIKKGSEGIQIYTRSETGVSVNLGRLHHAKLKRLQGIRGFDDVRKFNEAQEKAIHGLYLHLSLLFTRTCSAMYSYGIQQTFEKIVSKRDWKERPHDADKERSVPASSQRNPCVSGGGESGNPN